MSKKLSEVCSLFCSEEEKIMNMLFDFYRPLRDDTCCTRKNDKVGEMKEIMQDNADFCLLRIMSDWIRIY